MLDAHALGPDYSEITILIFNVYAYTFMRIELYYSTL